MRYCYRPCLFNFVMGSNEFWVDHIRNFYAPFRTQNLNSLVFNSFLDSVLVPTCVALFASLLRIKLHVYFEGCRGGNPWHN